MYEYVTNYKDDNKLCEMFFELPLATFGIDLKNWALRGNWGDSYICHSIVEDGKIVSNVSTTFMTLLINGKTCDAMQIGTVCTAPQYRGRGYASLLIKNALKTASDRGVFLFANPNAFGFYEKLGFNRAAAECTPTLTFNANTNSTASGIDIFSSTANAPKYGNARPYVFSKATPEQAMAYVRTNNVYSSYFDVKTIPNLAALYVEDFFRDSIYISKAADVCAIAELENGVLNVHALYGNAPCNAARLTASLAAVGARQARFDFMPDAWGLCCDTISPGLDETFTLCLDLPHGIAFPGFMRA